MKDSKALELLTDVAMDTPGVTPNKIRISSMIVIKNEIISIGSAMMKSHPFQKRFGKTEHSIFLHAEVNAIRKAFKKVDSLEDATLYICRLRFHYKGPHQNVLGYGIACPCSGCLRAIVEFDIKRVVYTIDSIDLKFNEL